MDTIQLVGQIWEPARRVSRLRPPDIITLVRMEGTRRGRARKVDRPGEGIMRILRFLETGGGVGKVLVAAFLGGAVNLELVDLVLFGEAVTIRVDSGAYERASIIQRTQGMAILSLAE